VTGVAYRLGAEELIELGRPATCPAYLGARRTFFGGRPGSVRRGTFMGNARLGQLDLLAQAGSFLAKMLSGAFGLLADLVNVPANILVSGVDLIFTNVAGLLDDIPVLGTLAAQILLIGNAVIKFGLQVPGMLLGGISNVLGGLSKALDTTQNAAQKAASEKDAKDKILDRAPDFLKGAVKSVLEGRSPSGAGGGAAGGAGGAGGADGTGAGEAGPSDLEKALMIGVPVAAAGALALALG